MSLNIERLRYYEQEYLRSFDFAAEQLYHVEMRRRLNLALHLWGIVEGLELRYGSLAPALPKQYYISPGMAIDAYGQEIYVFAPHALSADDLRANRITGTGDYGVWIAFTSAATTPPAPGYNRCNIKNQLTRWHESYRVFLTDDPGPDTPPAFPNGSAATALPAFSTLPTGDPDKGTLQVRLGTISVTSGSITDFNNDQRVYVGLRGQRIVTPTVAPKVQPSDPVLTDAGPLEAPLSLGVEANLFAEKNLIVGDQFKIDKAHVKPAPAGTFPKANGNVKIAGDLFLNGDVYANSSGDWLRLKEYIQSLLPDVQVGEQSINPTAAVGPDPSTGTQVISVTSNLKQVSSVKVMATISGITLDTQTNLQKLWTDVGGAASSIIQVTSSAAPHGGGPANMYDITIGWGIAPTDRTIPNNFKLPVVSFRVSYIIVFYP